MKLMTNQRWIPGYEEKYFATKSGRIFHVFPSGKMRELKGYEKGNVYAVKLGLKEMNFNRVIWETFRGPIPPGFVVIRKLTIRTENGLHNLRLKSKSEHAKKTGALSQNQAVLQLDEKGNVIDSWTSARKAAEDLFISRQTVCDYCNRRVKRPLFQLKWERGKAHA